MNDITLHSIFRHLTGDETFLSTIITENKTNQVEKKKVKKKGFDLMQNMVTEYVLLSPFETQDYLMLPQKIKMFLTPDYFRFGIKNIIEKDLNVRNISFLNSLNILLRPDIYKWSLEEHVKNSEFLKDFLCHRIQRNYQIDKTKNTRKVQTWNLQKIKDLTEGKISHELIQTIIDVFEINLLVFDLVKMEICLYWTKGTKYPFFNLFKNIYFMSYIQGNYEPIMSLNSLQEEQKRKIYVTVLTNISEIKCYPDLKMSFCCLVYLNTWDMTAGSYLAILENFFNRSICQRSYEEWFEMVQK